jgi:hypothetical protein
MVNKYASLEQYLRHLPVCEEEVTISFERIDEFLFQPLPHSARDEYSWWENQRQGIQVETNAWMDAGWMVDSVDLREEWVRFVRQ